MRCPSCGHENSDLATRCSACGATLTELVDDDPTVPTVPTASVDQPVEESTAERPHVIIDTAEQPAPELLPPPAQGTANTPVKRTVAKKGHVVSFFSQHQRALGVVLAILVVGVLAVVWLAINILDAPAYAQIEADLREAMPTYAYDGGTYGPDLEIPLSNVGVTARSASQTPESLQVTGDVGPTAYNVEAEAAFDDGKIRAVRNVSATYVRSKDSWKMEGELAEQGVSLTARAGVDENKVLANMQSILEAASASSEVSLANVYTNGSFSIVSNVFKEAADKDTATDDVTIACTKENGFYSFEGNVVAHFAFESGAWTLRSVEADSSAASRSYAPLIGTWSGELISTSGNGADCYGAQEHPLSLTIDKVGDTSHGSGQVTGTITVLAHYHKIPEKAEKSDSGDKLLEDVSFTGTVRLTRDEKTGSGLQIVCTTAGSPNSELEFTLTFGTYDDPTTVLAEVTSKYTYEESVLMFIPYQTTAKYTDTYSLSKS